MLNYIFFPLFLLVFFFLSHIICMLVVLYFHTIISRIKVDCWLFFNLTLFVC